MSLIKSISGIRGTIGGGIGEGLTPLDIVKFTAAYAELIRTERNPLSNKIVVGRDARISGEMLKQLVSGTLMGLGFDVVDIDYASTPTTELAVIMENAAGGIILTASHNPRQWNALKLLNEKGEFLNAEEGQRILQIADQENFQFADVDHLGKIFKNDTYTQKHIDHILSLEFVDVDAIKKADFKIAVDCINSVGGIAVPALLKALGVNDENINLLNGEPTGDFAHNPEPLPEHLKDISLLVKDTNSDIGFVVDPDVDRLAVISEDGSMFGEEYTLVAVADYILQQTPGNTVSNLSSSKALQDITEIRGGNYTASAVGEVNVVEKMKETNAVIGGEGNGGIIYPVSHYGRDALIGIALFLTYLAKTGKKTSELRAMYPNYYMAKQKLELDPETNIDDLLDVFRKKYKDYPVNDIDGIKVYFPGNKWGHLRKSNTEPIIRIYTEAPTEKEAEELAADIISVLKNLFIK